MLLYDSPVAPNPRRVRIFLAEKQFFVPLATIDLAKSEQWRPEFTAINPLQRIPALQLDSGEILTESVAICRYIEALRPDPPLFGRDALDSARVEMWQRRAELEFFLPVALAFRHSHPAMAEMEKPQIAEIPPVYRKKAQDFARFLDSELAQKRFLAGDAFSIADITALVAADFCRPARVELPAELKNLHRWRAEVSARPSAQA